MKSKKSKRIPVAILIIVLSMIISVGAQAAANTEVRAIVSKTISIVYHGQKQKLIDSNGKEIYPLVVNGTTYVPLKAVSQIFREPILWDASTQSAIIGSVSEDAVSALTGSPGGTIHSWPVTDKASLEVGGSTYKAGIAYEIWNTLFSGHSHDTHYTVWLDTNGRSRLTFTAYTELDCKIIVYGKAKSDGQDAGKSIYAGFIDSGTFNPKDIDISGYEQIGFVAERIDQEDGHETCFFFDPILK